MNSIKVYVVSLYRSKNRRSHMQKQMARLTRVAYEFVEAIDGKLLSDHELSSIADQASVAGAPEWLSRTAIGCALSHQKCYEKIVADGVMWGVVLEDDAVLSADFEEVILRLQQVLSGSDVALLYFSSFEKCFLEKSSAISLKYDNYQILKPRVLSQPIAAGAYLISVEVAKNICRYNHPVRAAADSWSRFYSGKCFKNLYCLAPFVARPAHFESEIEYGSKMAQLMKGSLLKSTFPVAWILKKKRERAWRKMSNFVIE